MSDVHGTHKDEKDMDDWGNDGWFLGHMDGAMQVCDGEVEVMVVPYISFALKKSGAIVHKTRSCHRPFYIWFTSGERWDMSGRSEGDGDIINREGMW